MTKKKSKYQRQNRVFISIAIIFASLCLTYAPVPGLEQTVIVVSGTELQAPLQELEAKFERENPNIKLSLKFQGSQEMVNKYIDHKIYMLKAYSAVI